MDKPVVMNSSENREEKVEEQEFILYLEETIDNICDRVRNKLVTPYAALQMINEDRPQKELIDRGIKEIQWLCFVYFPSIREAVNQMANNRKG